MITIISGLRQLWLYLMQTLLIYNPVLLYPTKLFDAVEQTGGLVIFSASEQFLLSSGAEALLTPETAKISYLSSYAFNEDT